MSERNDRTDDQPNPAAKPGDEEVSADELETLEDVSGGAGSLTGNNFNCGCGSSD